MVYWELFDWQSFSTLAAGLAAVAGAVAVGLRQASISEQQTKILERQNRLAELTLRSELFEKRYHVYNTAREYIAQLLMQAELPPRNKQDEFMTSMIEAQFLFTPQVYDCLEKILDRSYDFDIQKRQNERNEDKAKHADGLKRQQELFDQLCQDLKGLIDVMGEEMRLSEGQGMPSH